MRPTLHRSLPAELRIMPFNFRLLELIGILGPGRNFYRFVVSFGWGVFVILFPKAVLGMGSDQFDAITKGLAELMYLGNLYISMIILVVYRTSFDRMVQLLSEIIRDVTAQDQPRDCYDLIREQNSKINKFAKFYFTYCCFGPFIFCIPAMTTSYLRYYGSGNGTEPIQYILSMEQEFYGLQIRTNFKHYNIFMACSLTAYFVCSYLSVIKVSTLLIMIRYSSLSYWLVVLRIQKLDGLATKGSEQDGVIQNRSKLKEVVEIVQLHDKALEITDLVEKIINIPVAMQILSCIMFWVLIMFYASTNIDFNLINILVTFCLSMIETYGISYLGTELTESAGAIAEAIYDLNWYEDSMQLQRYYRLIVQRAQRETGITAAKFFRVDREKFMDVIRMTYSYYLVLKDTLNKL